MPHAVFHRTTRLPRRFHPAYSLLGRGLRRVVGDARHAEALYLVALSMLALGLLLAQYAAWIWLQPAIEAAPRGPLAVAFWGTQIGAGLLLLLAGVVGFAPAIVITATPSGLHLQRGAYARALHFSDVQAFATVSALRYYRHYARYAATDAFVGRMPPRVLLLHTASGPVALGLPLDDQEALLHILEERLMPAEAPIARVA